MAIVGNIGNLGEIVGPSSRTVKVTGKYGGILGWGTTIVASMTYGLLTFPLEDAHSHIQDLQTLAGLTCEHFFLIGLCLIPILMVAGKLGRNLGLPGLFRDPPAMAAAVRPRAGEPDLDRDHGFGTAFWGALGTTLLMAEVWTAIYYTEMVQENRRFGPEHFLHVPKDISFFQHAYECYARPAFWNHGELLVFLGNACWPFLALLIVAEVLPANAPGLDRQGWAFFHEVVRFLLGIVVGGVLVVLASLLGAWLLHERMVELWSWLYEEWLKPRYIPPFVGWRFRLPSLLTLDDGYPRADMVVKVAIMASHTVFALMLSGFYVTLTQVFRPRLSPSLGICIILGLVGVLYSVLMMFTTTGQAVVLALALVWFVYCNHDAYKYRFPGMARYDTPETRVNLVDEKANLDRASKVHLLPRGDATLDSWKKVTGQEKPKLVLVATTGGAYRASFWTTVVLDELSRRLPGFHKHVRLLTGASGGMVGAAYYVASMTRDGPPAGGVTDLLREESGLDSLTPVIRRLVSRDLPRALWPTRQETDRGVTLEEMWGTLSRTFPDLIEGERQGWRPSLIVSPMVIESGRRLLISNLDLSHLSENRAGIGPPEAGSGRETSIYSRPSVEFFRIFPEAQPTFRLQTAVRMSATFPFASPAVSLPTNPPRRVVDAGYYDNYGVDLAASWIYEHRQWIRQNTSGVALIQIRAYPCAAATTRANLALEQHANQPASAAFLKALQTSVQGLTSPLEGGMNAREWSMRFRNAGQLRILDDLLNDEPGQPRRFETFVFENFAEFAMNWFITDGDIAGMKRSIGADQADEAGLDPDSSRAPRAVEIATRESSDPKRILSALRADTEEATRSEKRRLIQWWERR